MCLLLVQAFYIPLFLAHLFLPHWTPTLHDPYQHPSFYAHSFVCTDSTGDP